MQTEMPIYITVAGWAGCPWYQKAVKIAENLAESNEELSFLKKEMSKEAYRAWVRAHKYTGKHTSSPACWIDDGKGQPESNFIGGHDAFAAFVKSKPVSTWFGKGDAG